MFGLALILTFTTFKDLRVFFAYLLIFHSFVVWAGLLELWTLIITIIIFSFIVFYTVINRNGGNL